MVKMMVQSSYQWSIVRDEFSKHGYSNSSKDVCCHEAVKAPDDVMVGAVGEPRFGVE